VLFRSSDLSVHDGRLHFDGLDLLELVQGTLPGQAEPLGTPLEVVYLPKITSQIAQMRGWFAAAAEALDYPAPFEYAYASKANSAQEVTRTALAAGAHYETSSAADVDIVRRALEKGWMPPDRLSINNGFKYPGSAYMQKLLELRAAGFEGLTPVIEDIDEIAPFAESGLPFNLGLRLKIDKHAQTRAEIAASDVRFGLDIEGLHRAAALIDAAPNLTLVMFHAMQSVDTGHPHTYLDGLRASLEIYAELVRQHPSLHMYNWGGGFPASFYELHDFDYPGFVADVTRTAQEVSAAADIPAPTLVGEFGRYTTAQHGFHLFQVIKAKDNDSATPWYLIDGSVMSSFPDAWALGIEFMVLPLNHLDKPFQHVRLGGLTCDTDDVFPTRPDHHRLYLPENTEDLVIGVFGIGSYQEMLGGVRGVKHCLLPEATELVIERGPDGGLTYDVLPDQSYGEILTLLGYQA
jgi:arginine decarboxylase